MIALQAELADGGKGLSPADYSPPTTHDGFDASATRLQYAAELDDAEYNITNSSQPSLTYSVSTHADSLPSICRREINGYATSDYASETGQQTPYEDDSDLDSLHHVVQAPRVKVKFMTPAAVSRDPNSTLRPLGMKKRVQNRRPITSPLQPADFARNPGPPTQPLPPAPPSFAGAYPSSRPRSHSNASSAAELAARRMQALSLEEDAVPLPPSSVAATTQRAPLSVLDEFEWHGTKTTVGLDEQHDALAAQQSAPGSLIDAPLSATHTAASSSTGHARSPEANGAIRTRASMVTLMPRRDVSSPSDSDHPFAFSPPSLSHDGFDDYGPPSLPGSARQSIARVQEGSIRSFASSASIHSNDLEPRELLRRAKMSKATCGLDEELGAAAGGDMSMRPPRSERAEVVDDLPPLLSTYYLAEQDLTKEQFDRLNRNPERVRAAHQAAIRAEMERKARNERNTLRGRTARDRIEEETVSILAAEAKFLALDPSGKSSHGGGGKISSLLKKKSSSSSKSSGGGGGGGSSSSSSLSRVAGGSGSSGAARLERLGRNDSRSEGMHAAPYRDGNCAVYSSPLLHHGASRPGTSSQASLSSRDLRSGGGSATQHSSQLSLGSYGSGSGNGAQRDEMSPSTSTSTYPSPSSSSSSSKGLAKIFGSRKK